MLHAIASALLGAVLTIGSFFGVYHEPQQPVVEQTLGAVLPSATAVFETSLQSRISSTDTSLTLVANSVRGGSTLSGYQCFTVDEGRTDAEYVCGTVSGTSVTSLTRGIDPSTGTTTNSTLKFAHRVGANVKITDFPVLQILRHQANGSDTYPNTLRYATGVVPTTVDDLTDKGYVDGVAFSGAGVIDATAIAKGVSQLATGCEAASSTASGSSGPLVIPASLASSTYNAVTGPCKVVVTGNSGKIDDNFIATSSLFTNSSFSGTTTVVTAPIVYTYNASATWTKQAGLKYVDVEVWGGGGGGGRTQSTFNSGGGGGGGYNKLRIFAASLGSTETVTIGAGGAGATSDNTAGSVGGNTTFGSHITGYGGGGGNAGSGVAAGGGGGGVTSVGSVGGAGTGGAGGGLTGAAAAAASTFGGGGGGSNTATPGGASIYGGAGGGAGNDTNGSPGGSSYFGGAGGGGGGDGASVGGTSTFGGNGGAGADGGSGVAGSQPGGGGGGGENAAGGAGGTGRVKVTEYYF
jgi:hypothetical protein